MKHLKKGKEKYIANRSNFTILCSELLLISFICLYSLNVKSNDQEYENVQQKIDCFFKPIQLLRNGEEQIFTEKVGYFDRDEERIGLTIGHLKEKYSCYNKFGILVKNIFIESRDIKFLIQEVEKNINDYYFELEVDARVDNDLLNELLDTLNHYSKQQIGLIMSTSENKRIVKVLPDHFEF